MTVYAFLRGRTRRIFALSTLLIFCAALCSAASIHGVVTDASGAKVTGATVSLISSASTSDSRHGTLPRYASAESLHMRCATVARLRS